MPVQTDKLLEIKINNNSYEDYVFMDAVLTKELLRPNELKFSMRKKSLLKTGDDIAFTISNHLLGAPVECVFNTLRRDADENICGETLRFKGIIFNVTSQRDRMGQGAVVHVTAYSPDYLLFDNPHCMSFENKALKDIIEESLENYSGKIDTEIRPKMNGVIPYAVQYNETTYQFLSRLAQRYGEFLYFEDGKMIFGKMVQKDTLSLHPDVDILGYRYELNMEHANFSHGQHNYLEYENYQENGKDYTDGSLHKLADYAYKHSVSLFKKETLQNLHAATQEDNEIEQLEESVKSQGFGARSQLMVCRATTNRADLKLGSKIIIREFYDKENGEPEQKSHEELLICRIACRLNLNGHFENEFTAIPAKAEYPPYGVCDLYPMAEPQRAIVRDNNDPEQLGRVRVQFLWQELQDDSLLTPWIRIAQPHGGDNKGFYFIPEIDEEVMAGFENGNAEKPYVIGTLYHGRQRPGGNWPNGGNDIKAIRTRNGHTIEIHDEGEGGYIRIYDNEKENYILTYSTDEKLIKLESTGNIELYAENDIIMEAGNNINMKAGVDINREAGENVNETAGVNITVEAGENISESAGNDISVSAGNDMDTSVGNNDSLYVGSNQTIEIGSNKDETISEKYQLTAENIREEANQKIQIYSQTHEQKADKEMKLDGGSDLDLYANKIKIN